MADSAGVMVGRAPSGAGESLAEFVLDTKYGRLPEELVGFTKVLVLKEIANVAAGASMPHSRKLVSLVRDRRLPGEVGVFTYGFRTSLWEGVFLNAFFAHAAELEDDAFFDADHNPSGPSWTITVIPLLLTLAERQRLSGKQLIESVVVGLEVHRRTCLSTVGHRGVMLGPGGVGPAAGAAKALGLNKEETMAAMGLAISAADVQRVNYGTDSHFFESSMQLHGLMAAEAAKYGLTGNPDLERSLALKFGDTAATAEKMLADLGHRWLCAEFWIKKYPASFGLHNAIDLMCELKKRHQFAWDDIEVIEAFPPGPYLGFVPKNPAEAELSLYWTLGVAAVDGDVTTSHMTDEALDDQIYQEAAAKVKQTCPPELFAEQETLPFSHVDRLRVHMKDGHVYSGERQWPVGSPKEPLTEEQVIGLFRKLVSGIYSDTEAESIIEGVLNLEELNDLGEITDLLTYRGERGHSC